MQSVGALGRIGQCQRLILSVLDLLPSSSAGDLPGEDVECLGGGQTTATVRQSHGDGVRSGGPKLSVHWQ